MLEDGDDDAGDDAEEDAEALLLPPGVGGFGGGKADKSTRTVSGRANSGAGGENDIFGGDAAAVLLASVAAAAAGLSNEVSVMPAVKWRDGTKWAAQARWRGEALGKRAMASVVIGGGLWWWLEPLPGERGETKVIFVLLGETGVGDAGAEEEEDEEDAAEGNGEDGQAGIDPPPPLPAPAPAPSLPGLSVVVVVVADRPCEPSGLEGDAPHLRSTSKTSNWWHRLRRCTSARPWWSRRSRSHPHAVKQPRHRRKAPSTSRALPKSLPEIGLLVLLGYLVARRAAWRSVLAWWAAERTASMAGVKPVEGSRASTSDEPPFEMMSFERHVNS
jgi:hypothetical protein